MATNTLKISDSFGKSPAEKAAIAKAVKTGLEIAKDYIGKDGLQALELKVMNATQSLRMKFHVIAQAAVSLATVTIDDEPVADLHMASVIFVELCNRAESEILKAHKMADGNPFKNIQEFMPVWAQIKGQVKKFFSGEGKAEGSEATDNPMDYDAAAFAVEIRDRKGRSAGGNEPDGLTDAVRAALQALTDKCSKVELGKQDELLLPILVKAGIDIGKTKLQSVPTGNAGERDVERRAAG